MERKCHEQIKDHEKIHQNETQYRAEGERAIQSFRSQNQNNLEELFVKVLEKSIYEKARDKMKQGKKKDEDDQEKEE